MAGYLVKELNGKEYAYEFHIDTPNLIEHIRQMAGNSRVMTFQADGDELAAVLHGFETYKKVGMVGFEQELKALIKKYGRDKNANTDAGHLSNFLTRSLSDLEVMLRDMDSASKRDPKVSEKQRVVDTRFVD